MMSATTSARSALPSAHSPVTPPAEPMALAQQLDLAFRFVAQHVVSLPEPYACCLLFFTLTADNIPVTSFSIRSVTVHAAWREGATRVRQWAWANSVSGIELRIDWACGIEPAARNHTRHADTARTWAVADDELEHAELLNALGHNTARNLAEMNSLIDPVHAITHAHWQLLLEGVYIDTFGELTALPRPRMSPNHLRNGPAGTMLHRATQQLIAQRQNDEGSWPEAGSLLDHLGITYALLLAQQHTHQEQRKGAPSALACHRAVAYFLEQMHRWSLQDYASEQLHALSLLVLVRYTHLFPGAAGAAAVRGLTQRLNQQLASTAQQPHGDAVPWAQLAVEALRQQREQQTPNDDILPAQHTQRGYNGKWLHASWPQLRLIADDGGRPALVADPWIAAAVMECAQRAGQPQFMSDTMQAQFVSNMQSLFRACYQRIVWPEVALFQAAGTRKQVAFFSPRKGNALVNDCREASQLLITICAVIHFSEGR